MALSRRWIAVAVIAVVAAAAGFLIIGAGLGRPGQAAFAAQNLSFRQGESGIGWPEHWTGGGDHTAYRLSVDTDVHYRSTASGRIDYVGSQTATGSFGTLTQCVPAQGLNGYRVRYSGYLRTAGLPPDSWGGLWMRVDGANNKVLAFDNLGQLGADRSVRGTTDWTYRDIVLDVPTSAERVCFGFLLHGEGTVWGDGLSFSRVGTAGAGPSITGKET